MLDVDAPELFDDDRHHLERVLRLRPGDHLTVGDGAGRWRPCRFGDRIEPAAAAVAVEALRPEVAVGFAVLKGGRSEHIVQKLTELGVDRTVPFAAERSVVRWDGAKAARQVERWRRVAREAVMQCRRPWLPHLEPVRAFGDLDLSGAALAVPGGRALAPGENFVLIGPEGGWTGTELAAGTRHVGLGPTCCRPRRRRPPRRRCWEPGAAATCRRWEVPARPRCEVTGCDGNRLGRFGGRWRLTRRSGERERPGRPVCSLAL